MHSTIISPCELLLTLIPHDSLSNWFSSFLSFITMSARQMDQYPHKLKSSLSVGPEDIPPIVLKCSGLDLPNLWSKLFDLPMISRHFTANLKYSMIFFILKHGSLRCINNYRTINNSSQFLKFKNLLCVTPSTITVILSTNSLLFNMALKWSGLAHSVNLLVKPYLHVRKWQFFTCRSWFRFSEGCHYKLLTKPVRPMISIITCYHGSPCF